MKRVAICVARSSRCVARCSPQRAAGADAAPLPATPTQRRRQAAGRARSVGRPHRSVRAADDRADDQGRRSAPVAALHAAQRARGDRGAAAAASPAVDVTLAVKAGGNADPIDKSGLAQFIASMLRKGTQKRTADQIAEPIDFVGGELDADAGDDGTFVTLPRARQGSRRCAST